MAPWGQCAPAPMGQVLWDPRSQTAAKDAGRGTALENLEQAPAYLSDRIALVEVAAA